MTLRQDQAKEARLNGARLPSAESLRRELSTLVFTPDRLTVVKGGPAARRAYFDRVLGRLFPARASAPQDYHAALAQRNAALRRVQLSLSDRSALEPWTERVAELGAVLVEQRRAALERLAPRFAERAEELGLPDARLGYEAEPPTASRWRRGSRATSSAARPGLGPHLDDVLVASGARDLRQFGSQGEQRLAVLALLLAEAQLLPAPPLLLLDDVLSELDPRRREVLATRVAGMGQTMITTTHRSRCPSSLRSSWRWSLERLGPDDPLRARPVRAAGRHGRAVERWPAAVGDAIARNAWPARIARDGTVHVNTADSVWAFELGQRAAEIAAKLDVPRLRFAPGPLPEPGSDEPREPVRPSPVDETRAAAIASAIEDPSLRETVQKAVELGLAMGRDDSPI